MTDQLSLRWSFLRNKGFFKQAGHFYVGFINWTYIAIGDHFIVNMPYGTYTYEIRETEMIRL